MYLRALFCQYEGSGIARPLLMSIKCLIRQMGSCGDYAYAYLVAYHSTEVERDYVARLDSSELAGIGSWQEDPSAEVPRATYSGGVHADQLGDSKRSIS